MVTFVCMMALMIMFAFTVLYRVDYVKNKNSFMAIDDTVFLRGFWCIVVILVHVPIEYQNIFQDLIGSFAFIGVTFFFMTSAYGLKYSIKYKSGYINNFWRKRLPPILIPALLANIFSVLAYQMNNITSNITVFTVLNIDNWVKVLILYYIIFWLVYKWGVKLISNEKWLDALVVFIVFIFSLVDCLTEYKVTSIWIVEPLGFAYGIIAARFVERIKKVIAEKYILLFIGFGFLSLGAGVAYLKFKTVVFIGSYCLKVVLGISITIFIFLVIAKLRLGNKINSFLSDISYEVYGKHLTRQCI